MWEGFARAESAGGELTQMQPYEEYAKVAAKGLVDEIIAERDRRQTKKK